MALTTQFYTLATGIEMVDVDYGAILLDKTTGKYWELNPVGSLVLQLVLSRVPHGSIIDNITQSYEVDADQAASDVNLLIDNLSEARLIVESAA